MASTAGRDQAAFNAGVTMRRRNLELRCGVVAAGAFVFEPIIGFAAALVWAVAYFAIQAVDTWAFHPVTSGKAERLPAWRKALGAGVMLLNTAAYGAVTIPLWLDGGLAGGLVAALVLAGGCCHAVMTTGGSRRVQVLTLTPLLLYLAATPLWLDRIGAGPDVILAAFISCVVFAGFVVAAHSRTQALARSEREARRLSDRRSAESEAAAADKSAFIAAVGHDLRTPLSAILTGAAELRANAADSAERSHAGLILDAGQMMNRLLDDLLDQSRLEAGRMQIEPVVFNLRDLLARSCRFWQGQARSKGLRLIIEGGRRVPAWVEADPTRVRQILNNLLSNAVKFTSEGEVRVRLNAWEADDGRCALTIEVADTGEGMDTDQIARLFRPFDQTRSGVAGRHGGSGLGLWISRGLAQLMDGRLTVRSAKGEGSAFTLALIVEPAEAPILAPALPAVAAVGAGFAPLPAASAEPEVQADSLQPPVIETDASADEDERPLRVLVVDDHDINRRAVQLILAPLGCDIAQAENGLAALDLASAEAFDVIFMDVRMPELDGRETTRRLRDRAGPNQHVPVIAVTADTAPDDVRACAAAGMTWFVGKPLTPASLLGALQAVLSGESRLEHEETQAA